MMFFSHTITQPSLPYPLIRSNRKSIAIQINSQGEVTIRAPHSLSNTQILKYVKKMQHWIDTTKARYKNTPISIRKTYTATEIRDAKNLLAKYLIPRVAILWENTGLPRYTNITITKAEYRWGSCSSTNRLCFSYRLADRLHSPMGRKFIDAVIIHELVHLQEKHHKKTFWDRVYQLCPDYKTIIKHHFPS